MLGMMWQSPKALDLLRDPRIVVHSVVSERTGKEGDFKLYGRVVDVQDPDRRAAYPAAIKARIGWGPPEPSYHLFPIGLDSAGFLPFHVPPSRPPWGPARRLPPPAACPH